MEKDANCISCKAELKKINEFLVIKYRSTSDTDPKPRPFAVCSIKCAFDCYKKGEVCCYICGKLALPIKQMKTELTGNDGTIGITFYFPSCSNTCGHKLTKAMSSFLSTIGDGSLQNNANKFHKCKRCGILSNDPKFKDNKMMRCSSCKIVWYCNSECQKQDWKVHKLLCQEYK